MRDWQAGQPKLRQTTGRLRTRPTPATQRPRHSQRTTGLRSLMPLNLQSMPPTRQPSHPTPLNSQPMPQTRPQPAPKPPKPPQQQTRPTWPVKSPKATPHHRGRFRCAKRKLHPSNRRTPKQRLTPPNAPACAAQADSLWANSRSRCEATLSRPALRPDRGRCADPNRAALC